jgi:hypothetical protein
VSITAPVRVNAERLSGSAVAIRKSISTACCPRLSPCPRTITFEALDVAVNEPACVRSVQCGCNLLDDLDGRRGRQRPVRDDGREVTPADSRATWEKTVRRDASMLPA